MSKKVCQFCGEDINKSDIFCKGCGAKLPKDEVIMDAIIDKDNTTKKDTNYLLYLLVILLIIILVVTGLIIFFKK